MSLRRLDTIDWCVAWALSGASVAIVLTNSEWLLRLYPSLVNVGLLVAFGATLVRGPVDDRKICTPEQAGPGPHTIRYTRRVTQVWCGFFALNGVFSACTALYWTREAWSLITARLPMC